MLTDKEIADIAKDIQADYFQKNSIYKEGMIAKGIRAALALDAQKREPEPAETPNRAGQWFKDARSGMVFGAAISSRGDLHKFASVDLSEEWIQKGKYVRIPPKLDGMDADECRPPVGDEEWYHPENGLLSGPMPKHATVNHALYGFDRWIKRQQPARKPWPALPVKVMCCNVDGQARGDLWVYGVQGADGEWLLANVRQEVAEAAALALNWTPRAAAWMHRHKNMAMKNFSGLEAFYAQRDALLAELDGWDMPDPSHTNTPESNNANP